MNQSRGLNHGRIFHLRNFNPFNGNCVDLLRTALMVGVWSVILREMFIK